MKKADRYGDDPKSQLKAAARDRAFRFLLADGRIRGVLLHGTRMVYEMRANHELGILETLLLGHGYLAAGLLSAQIKGNDRIRLQVECSGPLKGMVVEANSFGDVRGHLQNVPIPVDRPVDPADLSPFYGAGFLTVTRFLEDAKQPFSGRVVLEYGTLAKDLANYYLRSEQTPTAIHLSVKFDPDGEITGAGGLLLQVMPGADEEQIGKLESLVHGLPSLGDLFSETGRRRNPGELVPEFFGSLSPKMVGEQRVEFMCHCNRERIQVMLTMLPSDDLADMAENGPFPVEIRCHHCNTNYSFTQKALKRLYGMKMPNN